MSGPLATPARPSSKIGSTDRLWDKLVNRIYLGSGAWCKTIRKKVESKMLSDVHPQIQRAAGRPRMAAIVAAVAKAFGVKGSAFAALA